MNANAVLQYGALLPPPVEILSRELAAMMNVQIKSGIASWHVFSPQVNLLRYPTLANDAGVNSSNGLGFAKVSFVALLVLGSARVA